MELNLNWSKAWIIKRLISRLQCYPSLVFTVDNSRAASAKGQDQFCRRSAWPPSKIGFGLRTDSWEWFERGSLKKTRLCAFISSRLRKAMDWTGELISSEISTSCGDQSAKCMCSVYLSTSELLGGIECVSCFRAYHTTVVDQTEEEINSLNIEWIAKYCNICMK